MHAYAAELLRVPVVLFSGDEALCREVESVNPAIGTAAVLDGIGDSTVSLHPAAAVRAIKEGVKKAITGPTTVRFAVDGYYDVLRMFLFALYL